MKYLLMLLFLTGCFSSKQACVNSLLYRSEFNRDAIRTDVTVEQAITICKDN